MEATALALTSILVGVSIWITLRALRWALGRGPRFLAVARNVVDEGTRKRVATLVFVVSVVFVALVAWGLDLRDPLLFRIRNLLTYGIGGVVTLALLLTMVLGCGSVSSEFEEKQIYTALTKPLGRMSFLFGKWLGVILLDVVLLFGAGVHLYALIELQVASCEDAQEIAQASKRVLSPYLDLAANEATDPELRERFERYLPKYERRNARRREVLGADAFRAYAWQRFLADRRRIPPGRARTYQFDDVRPGVAWLQISARMVPAPLGGQIEATISIDGEPAQPYLLAVGKTTVIELASGDASRSVSVRIQLPDEESEGPIDLTEPHALEIVQPATNFASNLARGLLIQAVKLAFVAAMAVFAASFLSFPVATLTVALITILATASDYLITTSLEPGGTLYEDRRGRVSTHSPDHSHRHAEPSEDLVDAVLDGVERLGLGLAQGLRKYGEISPTTRLVDGRVVRGTMIVQAFLWIGGVWTGSVAVLAFVVFRRRELARVQI